RGSPQDLGALGGLGQRLGPGVFGRTGVTGGQPGQVVPERGRRRKRGTGLSCRIDLHQFADQDRHRPAVEDDVVVDQDERVFGLGVSDQGAAQRWGRSEVERFPGLVGLDPCDLLTAVLGRGPFQVDHPERGGGVLGHELHRAVQVLVPKADAQVGVAGQEGVQGLTQPIGVQRSGQRDGGPYRVDVFLVTVGVEEQPLLQWGEGEDVLQGGLWRRHVFPVWSGCALSLTGSGRGRLRVHRRRRSRASSWSTWLCSSETMPKSEGVWPPAPVVSTWVASARRAWTHSLCRAWTSSSFHRRWAKVHRACSRVPSGPSSTRALSVNPWARASSGSNSRGTSQVSSVSSQSLPAVVGILPR